MKYVVYKVTNKINGKIYIGKQCRYSKSYLGSGIIIKNAVKKYGKENFFKEILEVCDSQEELILKEIDWITCYNSRDLSIGYNISKGGEAREWSEKSKLSFKNRQFSDVHKENISKNHHNVSGKNNPMWGRNHSDLMKLKISLINKGKVHSSEFKEKASIRNKGELNVKAVLTVGDVIYIRNEVLNGGSSKLLADKFNVKPACISKIVNRRTWKHIP